MAPSNRSDPRNSDSGSVPAGLPVAAELLRERLLTSTSATATLEQWCAEHRFDEDGSLRAVRLHTQRPAPPAVRQALAVEAGEALAYRRVQLTCGQRVLSEADNWYRPALLSAAMIRALDGSQAPFGRVVTTLGFVRQTLREQLMWPPQRGDDGQDVLLEVRALLRDRHQRPFSYVVERYLPQVLP